MPATDLQPNACTVAKNLADDFEMLAQHCADLGDRTGAKTRMKVARTLRQLRTALIEANELCRSAHDVAKRGGKETNWRPFRDRLAESLERQHAVMYPEHAKVRAQRN